MNALKWIAVAGAAASFVFAAVAQAQTVDYTKSQIGFAARQMNVPAEGKFKKRKVLSYHAR